MSSHDRWVSEWVNIRMCACETMCTEQQRDFRLFYIYMLCTKENAAALFWRHAWIEKIISWISICWVCNFLSFNLNVYTIFHYSAGDHHFIFLAYMAIFQNRRLNFFFKNFFLTQTLNCNKVKLIRF